jgi:hypothetical protein
MAVTSLLELELALALELELSGHPADPYSGGSS